MGLFNSGLVSSFSFSFSLDFWLVVRVEVSLHGWVDGRVSTMGWYRDGAPERGKFWVKMGIM